ncbi:P-loop NTPase fold protein [Leptospira noguchii]|uniref:P-loop NTPase fold protein n=1 Tax=Leptospira noguchii TaxID=28182 RepID=UPI00035D7517|nr:P-loop NTPase fold protein [Leptospira noguchii]
MNSLDVFKRLYTELKSENLVKALLVGEWGIGKTYLINNLDKHLPDKRFIKVSLFGIKSISEIYKSVRTKYIRQEKSVLRISANIAKDLLTGFVEQRTGLKFNIDLLELIEVKLDKHHVLVFEDIERRHESLRIEEVLGSIDRLAEYSNCII